MLIHPRRAYNVADKYSYLFDKNPEDAFAITDDFTSSGRISGALGIPIPKLQIGKSYTIEPKNGSKFMRQTKNIGVSLSI